MGFTCLDRIGSMPGWPLDPDPLPEEPIALTCAEFESAVQMLEEIGFAFERSAEEAWPDFMAESISRPTYPQGSKDGWRPDANYALRVVTCRYL